jgi:uncharacterized membrane protein
MGKGRLEAFSDGVLAIIITITVLELRPPAGVDIAALRPVLPMFLSYVLSFTYIGIYWNNHHHLLHTVGRVTAAVLWANMHLLFWLSLIPFVTEWAGENYRASAPTALYGVVLFMAGAAYFILSRAIMASQGPDSQLRRAVGRDWKGNLSIAFYALGIGGAFLHPAVANGFYALVAFMWLVPDRRIERTLSGEWIGK